VDHAIQCVRETFKEYILDPMADAAKAVR
jgi:hypothetical protein